MKRKTLAGIAAASFLVAGPILASGIGSPAGATAPSYVNIGDASLVEGNTGSISMPVPANSLKFAVTMSAPAVGDTFVSYTVTGGSATAGTDFKNFTKPGKVKIGSGKTSAQISVPVYPDTGVESNETFSVTLTGILSGPGVLGFKTVGTGTILDDDTLGGTGINIGNAALIEGNVGSGLMKVPANALKFAVTMDSPAGADTFVSYTVSNGSATMGPDFKLFTKSGKVKIGAGKTSAQISIPVYPETGAEGNETFTITLTGILSGPGVLGGKTVGIGTILDDDTVGGTTTTTGGEATTTTTTTPTGCPPFCEG